MEAIADGPRPDGVMVPMVGAALEAAVVLEKLGATLPVLPLIETARGLDNAVEIGAVVGVVGLVFGDSISPWSWGRALGFAGKTAIHPAQIRVIHEVFTPSREEVERARAIVEADRGVDGGAVEMGGRMVDRPVVEAARRVLERAGEARRVEVALVLLQTTSSRLESRGRWP